MYSVVTVAEIAMFYVGNLLRAPIAGIFFFLLYLCEMMVVN